MTWTSIRLELARTPEHPQGSASRAYLLRLPLNAEGLINEASLSANPAQAMVHRHWPNEPDQSGYVIRTPKGWAISYRPGEDDDEAIFHLETHRIRIGDYVTLTEPDGSRLPFRVTNLKLLNGSSP